MGYHTNFTPIIHEDHNLLLLDLVAMHMEKNLGLMGDILRLLIDIDNATPLVVHHGRISVQLSIVLPTTHYSINRNVKQPKVPSVQLSTMWL